MENATGDLELRVYKPSNEDSRERDNKDDDTIHDERDLSFLSHPNASTDKTKVV